MGHDTHDPVYQNLEKTHKCDNCGETINAPIHCGHPMHLENLDSSREWVCWMGASCGHKEYDSCCDSPSIQVYQTVNK